MSNPSSRRQEIIEVALTLAEEHGVTGVTTVALARRLGFTEAALYRYFAGKTTILAAALQGLTEHLLATMLLELVPQAVKDPSGITAQLQRHADRFAARGGLLLELLIHAAVSRDEPLQQAGEAMLEEYGRRLAVYFHQAQELGVIGRQTLSAELSRLWLCQLIGGFVHSRLNRKPWRPDEQAGYVAFMKTLEQSLPPA